jgi:DNA-binding transcriptional MocR family regulator
VNALTLLRLSVAHGIAFTPGALFSASNKLTHFMRLNVARPWGRDLEQGNKTLAKLAGS